MAGSSLGTIFRMTTWGESHGKGVGVVLDGCPAGLPLCERDIQSFLDRRKPGQSRFTKMCIRDRIYPPFGWNVVLADYTIFQIPGQL